MSKLIDAIIDEARESTENETFDDEVGLSEEEIIKFVNQAVNRLHSKIVAQHPHIFQAEKTFNIVGGQESYSIPSHKAYLSNKVSAVEFSSTSSTDDLYPLYPTVLRNRDTGAEGDPSRYIRRSGSIYLVPTPIASNGLLRLTYTPKAKQLDKRRGLIKAVTTSGSGITNLEVNYVNGSTVDLAQLTKRTRITVVDKYGNIKMENVLIEGATSSASYDATITVDSSFTFEDGETISVDDYIISGAYSTTHLPDELGPEVERYIQAYVEYKILARDSSVDSQEMFQVLGEIEADIIASYADISDDTMEIPEINNDQEDWF
jgi:hypothetical protein